MKIIRLEAENVKRLRAVSITPDGAVVRIQGANGSGKTSVLDSIAMALGGEKLCPPEPVRRGEKSARAVVELDDDIIIERRWTAAGGTRLEVRNKAGLKYPSPQKLLDGLVGKLSFDPLEFLRLKPDKQAETLRQLAGVDFSILDARRRAAYDARTAANRQTSQLKARLAAMPEQLDAPEAPVSAVDLIEEHERRQRVKGANDLARREVDRLREVAMTRKRAVENATAEVVRLRETLALAEERQTAAERAFEEINVQGVAAKAAAGALVDPDLEEIPRRLRELEALNERVRAKRARVEFARELAGAEAEAAKHEAEIAAVDEQKEAALAQAAFPVPGLGFTDAGVTLNGLPLEQASGAEQLRVSLAMGIALNPKLRVVLIRDGSLLDERSLALVTEMAERAEMQVWLEVVGKGGAGIVIEDGQVEGAADPAVNAKGAA